jgi:hypothetical protein
MKNIRSSLLFLLFTAAISIALGTNLSESAQETPAVFSLQDFGTRYELDAGREGRLYRVHLTERVFEGIHKSYERDLAVFDSDGNPLPFVTRDAVTPYSDTPGKETETPAWKFTLPLLPLPRADDNKRPATMNKAVMTVDEGNRFIADLSRAKHDLSALGNAVSGWRLEFPTDDLGDTAAYMDIYASDNLRDWVKIAERAPLVHLGAGEDAVTSGGVDIETPLPRYIMTAFGGPATPQMRSVDLTVIGIADSVQIPDDAVSFDGAADPGEPSALLYDTIGVYPAPSVNFLIKTPGVYQALLRCRKQSGDEWTNIGGIKLSLIKNENSEVRNAPLYPGVSARYWQLARWGGAPPVMFFQWRPKEVVFMAQGKKPYILAFGSEKESPSLDRPDLIKEALKVTEPGGVLEARLSVQLAAAPQPAAAPNEPASDKTWRQYAVWAVLTSGALLLSWIAWNLIRGEKRT